MYDSMLPTERIALCTAKLMQGRAMTVREIAQEFEMSTSGAQRMLERISRVLPLVVDERQPKSDGYVWRINSGEPDPYTHDDPAEIRAALARQEAKRVFGEKDNGQ